MRERGAGVGEEAGKQMQFVLEDDKECLQIQVLSTFHNTKHSIPDNMH